ncbi:[FeFe] hydrogenase H-cluster radical SAM maturase HydE [Candidatus Peregrinibacteria bacterium]|nr:[FeFe] hydrogenase H-cluster radical SAM maturase HydE [Candidatus Peregrinibacteria bacterium]
MCLTIPAKVIKTNADKAVIFRDGVKKIIDARTVEGLKVGDWVLYISDIAIQKVSAKDAKEILDLLEYTNKTDPEGLNPVFIEIIKNSKTRKLNKEEIEFLLKTNGREKEALFSEADMIRRTYIKDFFCIHGIIEFSNYCKNDCFYCGLRKENDKILRYRMGVGEIVRAAEKAFKKGYKLMVLQSGDDYFYTKEKLVEIIKKIKEKCRVFIFISIGERNFETYKALREAGADGVLFRFETSNESLFNKLHPKGKNFKNRFKTLKFLKELKYFIATGSIVGLPYQVISDLAVDIMILRDMNADMISFGPFVPCPNTPFADKQPGDIDLALKMMSILRLEMKNTKIPVVTALETLDPKKGRKRAIKAGANALMFNITPKKYQPLYEIYKRRDACDRKTWEKYGLYNTEESYKMLEEKLRVK